MHPAAIVLMSVLSVCSLTASETTVSPQIARDYHVRALDGRVRDLIKIGGIGSRTFAGLIERLAASDLIVYVQTADSLPGGVGGQLSFVTKTATVRYVRIELSPEGSVLEKVALLGHELQHAVEVANAPRVTDSQALAMLYLHIGTARPNGTRYESAAARYAGDRVRDELQGYRGSLREGVSGSVPE
jgi:hypothetical protein